MTELADFIVFIKNIIFIIFALLFGLIARRFISRGIKVYCSKNPLPRNDIVSIFDMLVVYVFSTFCAIAIGSPIISLVDKINILSQTNEQIDLCGFLSIIIIVLSSMRLLRIIDKTYVNQDVITWFTAGISIITYIALSKIEIIQSKFFVLIPTTGPEAKTLQIGAFLVFAGSLIIIVLIEFFGRKIQNFRQNIVA